MSATPEMSEVDLEEAIRLLELECHSRQTKIRQSSSMKDIAQLCDMVLRGDLHQNSHRIRGLTQLHHAAEVRLRELLGTHMIEMRAQGDVRGLEQLRSHFLHREWAFLKGTWPLLYREAETESEKVLQRLERETDSRVKRTRGK